MSGRPGAPRQGRRHVATCIKKWVGEPWFVHDRQECRFIVCTGRKQAVDKANELNAEAAAW